MDQETADGVLQKVGTLAVLYYPQLQVEDPTFSLAKDVAWCLEGVSALAEEDLVVLRDAVGRTILDPSAFREPLTALVYGHVSD